VATDPTLPLAGDEANAESDAGLTILWPLGTVGQKRGRRESRAGGKASALGRLAKEGYPVPRGWVLEARWFERAVEKTLPKGHDMASLLKLAGTPLGVDRAARARERLLTSPLPNELRAELATLWALAEPFAPWGLAVRSSGTTEDDDETSLAGFATTVLGARGAFGLEDAVRRVWASAVYPRAIDYLANAGSRDFGMAVLLQVVVPAEAAGVLFTAPPPGLEGPSWRRDERLLNVTFGLGAPVVEGARATDTVRFAKGTGAVIAESIAQKDVALVVGERGLEERAVPLSQATQPALDSRAKRAVIELAERLEKSLGGPLDVELALTRKTSGEPLVYVLQVRRPSSKGFPEGGDEHTVWSRANVGEALPGAATPLTWSVAKDFSDHGFREAFGALGCVVPKDAQLVASIHGRFYLNLSAFMRIAAQVPGLSPRAILGVSGGASEAAIHTLEKQVAGVSSRGFLLRLPLVAPRLIAQQAGLEAEATAFEREAERARRTLFEMDLGLLPDDGLATTLTSARKLLHHTGGLMLRCASASLASHLALVMFLQRALTKKRAQPDDLDAPVAMSPAEQAGHVAKVLTGGVLELDSARPGLVLSAVAALARQEPAAREALAAGGLARIEDLPEGPTRRALERFLAELGDRAVREAELATPRWSEDPRPIFDMLAAATAAPHSDGAAALARARALADRELALLEARLPTLEITLVRALVTRAQRFTRLRERLRGWVTRVLGLLRLIAKDADRRLRRIDPTLAPDSAFFCTYDELVRALGSGRADVGPVVRLRRAQHARDEARPDPPATFVGRPPPVVLPPAAGALLKGLAASGGVVEGPARVLEPGQPHLEAVRAGEILVSRTTDVGLSPLFLVAAGVVTELGGPLSHAAVIAREYGVPAVVNVSGATVAIRTGDRVRVDGDRGLVELLDKRRGGSP
jgi:phosphohistidine swiveling domain-containing protein